MGATYLPRDLFMRFIIPTITVLFLTPLAALAGGEAEAGLPLQAARLWNRLPITNSMVMVWLAVGLITLFCRAATKQMALVPAGFQNFAEWVVESLYDFLSSILGPYMVKKTFWFFGSIFLFILVSNLLGLIPGVGTIGVYNEHGHIIGFLRGGNADLNMTLAMALIFAVLWFYWALTENGVKGFLAHIFAPKGEFHGMMFVYSRCLLGIRVGSFKITGKPCNFSSLIWRHSGTFQSAFVGANPGWEFAKSHWQPSDVNGSGWRCGRHNEGGHDGFAHQAFRHAA